MKFPQTWAARLVHKIRQTERLSKKSIAFLFLLAGSALVTLTALLFTRLADLALEWNALLAGKYPWFAWVALPLGSSLLTWFTRKFAPYTSGSGIPQVIASLSLPHDAQKTRLIHLGETFFKIPLTSLGMILGAPIGREGPSVQVGAAVMNVWGAQCKKYGLAFRGMQENGLIAADAAGDLVAAFNAPLAGVVFAIEELGCGVILRWERQILMGVLAAGFIQVAIQGNNPYFSGFQGHELSNMLMWAAVSGIVCGMVGGLFGSFLYRGTAAFAPVRWRSFIRRHLLVVAFVMGILLALLDMFYQGKTYGTGYHKTATALKGAYEAPFGLAAAKWAAIVFSYWTSIPDGIFTPSLTIGAMISEHMASFAQLGDTSNVAVLFCTAAFLIVVTQSPLTAAVVVMEMTDGQDLLFWILLTCIFASQVLRQFSPHPFYHAAGLRFRQRIEAESGHVPHEKKEQIGT